LSFRKRIAVLGSTGSIGQSVLSVVEANPEAFEIVGLSALRSAGLLNEQARRFGVRRVAIADESAAGELDPSLDVAVGESGLVALASDPDVDLVINALVGTAGLPVTFSAVSAGKRLAVANKESLVMAGGIVTETARRTGSELIPVDSEHSSIFRCMRGAAPGEVRGVVLTASGGPLRDVPLDRVDDAGVAEVLAHPTWDMGSKITVDSATLVNKAMEVIEAAWLFGLRLDQIDVVVHRESIVHSFVTMRDGSMLAHLGAPDMRVPIQYAMFYPDAPAVPFEELIPEDMVSLSFEPVSALRYPCFELVLSAARDGGTAPTVAVTADEVAVHAFLDERIRFGDIATVVSRTLESTGGGPAPDLAAIRGAESAARSAAESVVSELAGSAGGSLGGASTRGVAANGEES
jgi:1-deoxy-D-xylulose-5-phosphate reductoisomerase